MEGLDFRGTPITALPAWVAECTSLEKLTLSWCKKLVEPPDVSTLTNLGVLDLRGTEIVETPDVSTLTNLKWLALRNTMIVEPPDVSTLTSLKNLDLCNTKIVEPPDVSTLTKLEDLRLYGCDQLRALPDVSANKKLTSFDKPKHLE